MAASWFVLGPEVAGGLGPRTVMDRSVHPPSVKHLHYVLDGWLGDDLLESFPCFMVTRRAQKAMLTAGLTGCTFEPVEVTTSPECRERQPHVVLPEFLWLRPGSGVLRDDVAITSDARLVVSSRALAVLQRLALRHCEVEAFGQE